MPVSELSDLKIFETRVRQLILDYQGLRRQNAELKSKIESLEAKIEEQNGEVEALQNAYEKLKLAKMMGISSGDVEEAKQKITKLIREIEKCIALINI